MFTKNKKKCAQTNIQKAFVKIKKYECTHKSLKIGYKTLESDCRKLKRTYKNLKSDYKKLKSAYKTLKSDWNLFLIVFAATACHITSHGIKNHSKKLSLYSI